MGKRNFSSGARFAQCERDVFLNPDHRGVLPGRLVDIKRPGERLQQQSSTGSVRRGVGLRQIGVPHEEAVAFAGRSSAFVKSPYNQALAATGVSCGEDLRDARLEFAE